MTLNKTLIGGALMVALLGTAAVANAKGPMGPQGMRDHGPEQRISFEELDADKDGKVTEAELAAQAETRFKDADTNGDGTLSVEELVAAAQERALERQTKQVKVMVALKDTNDDGVLSLDEMKAGPRGGDRGAAFFDRFDKDNDGVVTEEEFADARDGFREKMQKRFMKRHGAHQ